MIYLASACLAVLAFLVVWQSYAYARERAELLAGFATERQQWVRERRDLNTRIQAPQAAPYLLEDQDETAGDDDLPILPEFTMDEAALDRAKAELLSAGYESGPAT